MEKRRFIVKRGSGNMWIHLGLNLNESWVISVFEVYE